MNTMYKLHQAGKDEVAKLEGKDKAAALKALAKYSDLAPLTTSMLGSFMDEGVIATVPVIAESYDKLAGKILKEVNIEIAAAAPLSDRQKSQIMNVVQKYIDSDSKILLSEKVDTSLIAGFQLQIEDRFVDLTAKSSYDGLMSKVAAAS